jgi:hypothetical protein
MFVIFATKPLNDGTKGFRFNMLGMKGMLRKRKHLSRGYRVEMGKAMRKVHLGKVTVYLETKGNSHSVRQLRHFAG